MFLFDIGVEPDNSTAGEMMLRRASFFKGSDFEEWRNEINQPQDPRHEAFRREVIFVDNAVKARDPFRVLSIITDAEKGLRVFENLRDTKVDTHNFEAREQRSEQHSEARYPVMLAIWAIYGCFSERWAEPLSMALKSPFLVSEDLRYCVTKWLADTNQVNFSAALNAKNYALATEIIKVHSNQDDSHSKTFMRSVIAQCFEQSERKPLEGYLKLDPEKYPNYRREMRSMLERMAPPAQEKSRFPFKFSKLRQLIPHGQKLVISHGKLRIK